MSPIDFDFLKKLYSRFADSPKDNSETDKEKIQPLPFTMADEDQRREMWEETGNLLLKQGAVAAFTLAGGQGSRLGFEGPLSLIHI